MPQECHQNVNLPTQDNREFRVMPAPGPEEVNWQSLWFSYRDRVRRGWLLKPLLVVVILIPMPMFSAALMQLSQLICPSHQ